MKLLDYFTSFLRDTVNLNQSRIDDLDSRVDSITAGLKSANSLSDIVLDTVPQGSWAHETIIRPVDGLEFDADFLVQIAESASWNADPQQYSLTVWKALHDHHTYGSMTRKKDRCVRVTYANDCHIDIVPYVVQSSGSCSARSTRGTPDTTTWSATSSRAACASQARASRLSSIDCDCVAHAAFAQAIGATRRRLSRPRKTTRRQDCHRGAHPWPAMTVL